MSPTSQGRFADPPQPERAWAVLRAAGLPDGAIRPQDVERFADDQVRSAVRALAPGADLLDQTSRELLLGWLCALRDHFNQRFGALLGTQGDALISALEATAIDAGRFIKFRRIAIGQLARLI